MITVTAIAVLVSMPLLVGVVGLIKWARRNHLRRKAIRAHIKYWWEDPPPPGKIRITTGVPWDHPNP